MPNFNFDLAFALQRIIVSAARFTCLPITRLIRVKEITSYLSFRIPARSRRKKRKKERKKRQRTAKEGGQDRYPAERKATKILGPAESARARARTRLVKSFNAPIVDDGQKRGTNSYDLYANRSTSLFVPKCSDRLSSIAPRWNRVSLSLSLLEPTLAGKLPSPALFRK